MTGEELRRAILVELYGTHQAKGIGERVEATLDRHRTEAVSVSSPWSQHDAWLITYADQFQTEGEPTLRTLDRFLGTHLDEWLNGVHVLPFYPWSSDDGFSIMDYTAVDPDYGDWAAIEDLARSRRLVVDAVINHMSSKSAWFEAFLREDEGFTDLFRTADPDADLSTVVRPRVSPLLTEVERASGSAWVWTTFSDDQVDLDYRHPDTLVRVLEVLLSYAEHGAGVIRLDAIAFLWKDEGTTCLHLPQTHAVVQLIRSCFDSTYPDILLLTETNVPHAENISYFGDGTRPEAQIVYQFPLAPLVLDAFRLGDASLLRRWATHLEPNRPGTTFLNFLASHDGVGVRPAEGILPSDRVAALADLSTSAGGAVGSRTLQDGTETQYELNCTWFDLMAAGHTENDAIHRHLASHAVMLAMRGIPAFYVHSLFGSSNDHEGFRTTGRARSLNRHKFANVGTLESGLSDPSSRSRRVLTGIQAMLGRRAGHPAFHPDADQRMVEAPPEVIAVDRIAGDGMRARVLVNCSSRPIPTGDLASGWFRLDDGRVADADLPPWTSLWLSR
jgi:sucrose phosphorylase